MISLCLFSAGELAWVSFVRRCDIQDQDTGLPSWRGMCFQQFAVVCIKLIIKCIETFLFFCKFHNIFTLYFGLNQLLRNKQKLTRLHVLYNIRWLWVKNTKFSFYSLCIFSAVVIKNNSMYHLSIIAGSLAGTGHS